MKPRLHLDDFLAAAERMDADKGRFCCCLLGDIAWRAGRGLQGRIAFEKLFECGNYNQDFGDNNPANQRTRVLALLLAREFFRTEKSL